MHHNDASPFNGDLAAEGDCRQLSIVVTTHCLDGSYAFELRDRVVAIDVSCMQDEIDPVQGGKESIRQTIQELGTVGVSDDPDSCRQLLDPGRLQAGRVCALGIGSGIERMERGRGENVRARLVQVQVDVGERKPRAVGLPSRVDTLCRRRHRGGRDLRSSRNILATRQRSECGLGRGVTCVDRRATPFRPSKPFGIRTVFRRWHHPFDLGVLLFFFLLDHRP